MDFQLNEELLGLQQTVRRLAQDKIKPRAREIDTTGDYPQDIQVTFGQDEVKPGAQVDINIQTQGEAKVGLAAVDRSMASRRHPTGRMPAGHGRRELTIL